MPDDSLIVPTVVPSGSLHFATIHSDGTMQDIINVLLLDATVIHEVLGDLEPYGWALQKIRKEPSGRQWEEEDLEQLGNGVLPPSTHVASLLNASSTINPSDRHFSAFPLTSHLHAPVLRLISLHPYLALTCSFLRVPEVHDGFQWKSFVSRTSIVQDVHDTIIEELGLTKALAVPGGGNLEYVLEEVWTQDDAEKSSRLPFTTVVSAVLETGFSPNPFTSSPSTAVRTFRFCVPDEWYRRSKIRSVPSTVTEPSEDTIKRLSDLESSEEEGEGTAKQKDHAKTPPSTSGFNAPSDWRSTISQNRLSSIFDSWMHSSSTSSPNGMASPERKTVSEPKLVQHLTGGSLSGQEKTDIGEENDSEFELMLDELGLKGPKRDAMYNLPPEQRRYLLQSNRESRASTVSRASSSKMTNKGSPQFSTYGPASAAGLLPRLVPQLTGDSGIMKRLSMASWGASSSSAVTSPDTPIGSGESDAKRRDSIGSTRAALDRGSGSPTLVVQPQSTGGLWSSWWASSGGEKGASDSSSRETDKTAKWYVDGIRSGKPDTKLVKHLISLRVHLSTANIAWIEDFVDAERGMEILGKLLAGLVSKGGKRRKLADIEGTVLLEAIKCLRVLLNTEPGFDEVLASPTLITHIAYSLHGSSPKLRTLASEVLAAICVLSLKEGHKAALSAMSDYRVEFEESFRFQELIASLRLPDLTDEGVSINDYGYDNDEDGVWEARTASMALINALTNCPDALEDRVMLREEFGRRGLNEVIVTLRYIKPPESLITQLDVYTEEKFEDEEDVRERARSVISHEGGIAESEPAFDELLHIGREHEAIFPAIIKVIEGLTHLVQRDVDDQLKVDLISVISTFVEELLTIDDLEGNWSTFMDQFMASVQYITGQVLKVHNNAEAGHEAGHEQALSDELDALRIKLDELNDERAQLRSQLEQQTAEINTLKSLTSNASGPAGRGKNGPDNFQGVVQRLVAKEKQVLQLQTELDKLKAENPSESREADERAKRERDRVKWNTLMEEIASLKMRNGELEASANFKQKEIVYLKRALESVYSRFRSREESKEAAEVDAEVIVARAIDSLTQKDALIATLRSEIGELKLRLAEKPKFITEIDYKRQVAPPPPPPPQPKQVTTPPLPEAAPTPEASPIPPPPPPPPLPPASPLAPRVIQSRKPEPTSSHPPPAPPPPPPPPPLLLPPVVGSPANGASPPSPPPPPPPPLGRVMSPPASAPGAPPPPPPPPSAYKAPKPKVTKPTKRLKPFFWNKLTTPPVNTVWNDAPSDTTFNLDDLEATFMIDNTSSGTSSQISVASSKKQNVTTLLDITRANNVAIMLSRIKLTLPEIRTALLAVDDQKLSIDELKAISRQLPTAEEINRLKGFGDVSKLAKADQYFYQIMTIPRVFERMECMLYRRKHELEVEEIRPELDIVRNASHQLRTSPKFKKVLQAVLAVGNALNGSSFRGGARGFRLEALTKMGETKTAKGGPECPTLLHYLARVLLRTDPTLATFIEDMPHLEAAARVSVPTIMASLQSMTDGLKQVTGEIQILERTRLPAGDNFVAVMQPFVGQVSPSVDALRNMGTVLDTELKALLAFYGEDPDSPDAPKPEDFFGLVLTFSSSLQKAALEVHDAEAKAKGPPPTVSTSEEPAAETELTIKKGTDAPQQQGLLAPPSSQSRATGRSIGRGDLDSAIRSIRTGQRRTRAQHRPLSKIFVDGARTSRIYE